AGPEHRSHQRDARIVVVSGPVPDLMQEDSQEVHRAGGGATGGGAEAVGAEDERELRGVARGGVDEPAAASRVDVYANGGGVGPAEDAIGKVGDKEGRGAGGKGEALGGESVGPNR